LKIRTMEVDHGANSNAELKTLLDDKDNEIYIALAAGMAEKTIVMKRGLDADQQRLAESAVERERLSSKPASWEMDNAVEGVEETAKLTGNVR
jgi:hypothetical protein